MCFVLNDLDTSAYMVGQNVLLPTEPTEQTPLTPTASAAVDIKNAATFDVRAMDDNDEPRATEADHRTGWKKPVKSGTYGGMLYGIVLRDYPKQVVSLATAKGVPTNMREFLSWAERHYCIDVTASTVERKTGGPASAGACPGGCKEFSRKGSNAHFIRLTCKICGTVRREERHPLRQDAASCSHRHWDHRRSNAHTRKTYCVDCGTHIDSAPREIFNTVEATRSAPSNRNEELADRVSRETRRSRSNKSIVRQE